MTVGRVQAGGDKCENQPKSPWTWETNLGSLSKNVSTPLHFTPTKVACNMTKKGGQRSWDTVAEASWRDLPRAGEPKGKPGEKEKCA